MWEVLRNRIWALSVGPDKSRFFGNGVYNGCNIHCSDVTLP